MDLVIGTSPSWSLLIVRLALGVIFFAHGAQKMFGWFAGHGLKGTIGYFRQSLQIPPALTVLAGLLARPAALGLCVVTIVAMTKVHLPHGFFINWSLQAGKGHGYEMNLALLAMALAVLAGGAGAFSFDRLIAP